MRTVKMSTYLVRQADMHRNRMVILYSCGVVSAIVGPCINLLAGIFGGLILLMVFCYLGAVEQIKWAKFMQGIRGEDLFNASLSAAIDRFIESLPVTPDVAIVGGGPAEIIKKHIATVHNITAVADPMMANAVGYWYYGTRTSVAEG